MPSAPRVPIGEQSPTKVNSSLNLLSQTVDGNTASIAALGTFAGVTGALGFTPVQQGGGAGQGTNKIFIGWSGSILKAQVDVTDMGAIYTAAQNPFSTTAQYLANSGGQAILGGNAVWSAASPVAITFAGTVTLNFATMINAWFSPTTNFTLAAPINVKPGQFGVIEIIQGAGGSHLVAFDPAWHFPSTTPVLSTAAGAVDLLYYYVDHGNVIRANLVKST